MRFEYATAQRIVFGPGTTRELVAAARSLGKRPLLVTGANPDRVAHLVTGLDAVTLSVPGEPSIEWVREGTAQARDTGRDLVISIGGGSALDAGKAIAALLANPGDPLDYLEVIGKGQPLPAPPVPFVAVPTTAGTGSEATRNAVLGSAEHHVKASLRSVSMLPRLAIVDPDLTVGVPPKVTAATGLDALTQVIEPYVSSRANPMTDLLCVDGMRRAAEALPQAWANGADSEARRSMAWASLLGGMALANAGLGVVHAFAAPVGGMFPAPHGAICAAVLPHAMSVNVRVLRERAPRSEPLRRYDEVARLLTGRAAATADDAVAWVAELCRRLEIPPLRTYGVTEGDLPALAEKAAVTSSMKGNPVGLTKPELIELIRRAL